MKDEPRILPRSWEELEEVAGLKRNQPPAPTRDDVTRMERKILSSWGRKRRKFQGP